MREKHLRVGLGSEEGKRNKIAIGRSSGQLLEQITLRAARAQANFLAGIAAQNRTVVDKRHPLTEASRGERCSAPRYASTDHQYIELSGIDGLFGKPSQPLAPGAAVLIDVVWRRDTISAQVYRVTAAIESRQVMQRKFYSPLR